MIPNTRQELREWCLRKLGAPVIKINVDEDQVEDRIDEALEYFRSYHFDGVEHIYLKHLITASVMTFVAPIVGTFVAYEKIIGQTSGAICNIIDQAIDNLSIRFVTVYGTFQDGEVILGETSGATGTLIASGAIVLGDLDNRYIPVTDDIVSVFNILPPVGSAGLSSNMFDVRYQFALNNMYNLISSDLITYSMFKDYLALWEYLFQGKKGIRFNRKTNKIFLDLDWTSIPVDTYLIVEAWKALDPQMYPKIYGDYWVREYTYILIKQQWAQNLKKYQGIQLPGGLTLNGQQMWDEAVDEMKDLERRLHVEFTLPPDPIIG